MYQNGQFQGNSHAQGHEDTFASVREQHLVATNTRGRSLGSALLSQREERATCAAAASGVVLTRVLGPKRVAPVAAPMTATRSARWKPCGCTAAASLPGQERMSAQAGTAAVPGVGSEFTGSSARSSMAMTRGRHVWPGGERPAASAATWPDTTGIKQTVRARRTGGGAVACGTAAPANARAATGLWPTRGVAVTSRVPLSQAGGCGASARDVAQQPRAPGRSGAVPRGAGSQAGSRRRGGVHAATSDGAVPCGEGTEAVATQASVPARSLVAGGLRRIRGALGGGIPTHGARSRRRMGCTSEGA